MQTIVHEKYVQENLFDFCLDRTIVLWYNKDVKRTLVLRIVVRCSNEKREHYGTLIFQVKMLCLFTILLAFAGFAVNADGLLNTERYQSVNVQPGDTLWSIASRNVSEETDIRAYVFELQEINHISNPGTITPGQSILIPRK